MKNLRANSQRTCSSRGFALVITLIMVALLAIIAVGLFTSTSLERVTAKSYEDRYQAELAAQNGLEAAKQTLVATPFPSPVPSSSPASVTGTDTFLVVRADGPPDANGNKPAYYYIAQPSASPGQTITYYPLFSAATDPSTPTRQTTTINLTAPFAPAVPTPSPPANSTASDSTSAWNTAKTQRLPTLYSWAQSSPSPSGPSVKWVEMRDPHDTRTAACVENVSQFGYGYGREGELKANLNPSSYLRGKNPSKFETPLGDELPNFHSQTAAMRGGRGHSGAVNYLDIGAANIIDLVST